MKRLQIIFNVVLLIAVAFLFYLHCSTSCKKCQKNATVKAVNKNSQGIRSSIAYVELDSLNEKIFFIKNKRKELEAEQQAIETDWENSYRSLENQKNNFLKKGAAITQQEAQDFQNSLLQQQQVVDNKKQSLSQKLNEKSFKIMEDIQTKLKDYLAEYNQEKNFQYIFTTGNGLDYMVYKDSSLNITGEVIEGMNEKLKSETK